MKERLYFSLMASPAGKRTLLLANGNKLNKVKREAHKQETEGRDSGPPSLVIHLTSQLLFKLFLFFLYLGLSNYLFGDVMWNFFIV